MTTATLTIVRTGRVLVPAGWVGDHHEYRSHPVRQWSDGDIEYYIGMDRCVSGWAMLPAEHHGKIVWAA